MSSLFAPRAVLLDFYGTVVHEDDVPVAEICSSIADASPCTVTPGQVGEYWWKRFREWCARSYGPHFQSQRALERLSLQDVLERFRADLDVDELGSKLYVHWMAPDMFQDAMCLSSCGVPLCLVSNIDRADLFSALVHNGLYFPRVVTSEACRSYKPRPEMFDQALESLNLSAGDVLHVGDSLSSDVRGAKDRGIRVLWINRKGRSIPEADDAPDHVASTLAGLRDIVPQSPPHIELVEAAAGLELQHIRALFRAYADELGIDLAFQNFEQELAVLPGQYVSPGGCLLMATLGPQVTGCVALRPLEDRICEMKRLYVCPAARGQGVGRTLAREVVTRARELGYARMRLDTLPWMEAAIAMYRILGFYEIEPYCYNPIPGTVYMELVL